MVDQCVGVRASSGLLPSHRLRIFCPLEVSQCHCGWWSPACGLFNMDILLLSLLSCHGTLILSAHSPCSSVSLAAFPAGILHAVSHLPTGAPFLPHAHMLATHISAWPQRVVSCLLVTADCLQPGKSVNFFAIQWVQLYLLQWCHQNPASERTPALERVSPSKVILLWIMSLRRRISYKVFLCPTLFYHFVTILHIKLPCLNYCVYSISWLDVNYASIPFSFFIV